MAFGRGTPVAPLPASLPTVVALSGSSYHRGVDWRRVGGGIFLIGFAPWLFGFWPGGFLLALVGLLIWAIASIVHSAVQESKAPQTAGPVRAQMPITPAPVPREVASRAAANAEALRQAESAPAPGFPETAVQLWWGYTTPPPTSNPAPGFPEAPVHPPPPPSPPAGWYPDPHKRYEQRYWDGAAWTDSVLVNGESILEPPSFY